MWLKIFRQFKRLLLSSHEIYGSLFSNVFNFQWRIFGEVVRGLILAVFFMTVPYELSAPDCSPSMDIDVAEHRFPHCIVWTPIPLISWMFPFIGHMGIATTRGVIRDFAGNYFVSEDFMAFGWPSSYWQLSLAKVAGDATAFDKAIDYASDEYKSHMHNLFCDNCHSYVALALNRMAYAGRTNWNMVNLCFYMLVNGRFIGVSGFFRQYLPWLICTTLIVILLVITFI